ncbi:tRNA ligase subunit PheS family protein [Candidatus Vidania fulgoroideorum]
MKLKKFFDKIKHLSKKNIDIETLKILKSKLFGKNGILNFLTNFFLKKKDFKSLKKINKYKTKILFKLKKINNNIDIEKLISEREEKKVHPITFYKNVVYKYFSNMGFKIKEGCEIENTFNNFDFLRCYKNHPSRSLKDTFYINKTKLLRTHMSSMQSRCNCKYPRNIFLGKVFRRDVKDKNHFYMFHQIDGLILEKISILNLISIIEEFLIFFFNEKKNIRIRTSSFPFTNPSFEIDVKNYKNEWVEIAGLGIVHYKIRKKFNKKHAFAFGIGLERIIALKENIKKIYSLYNDIQY